MKRDIDRFLRRSTQLFAGTTGTVALVGFGTSEGTEARLYAVIACWTLLYLLETLLPAGRK